MRSDRVESDGYHTHSTRSPRSPRRSLFGDSPTRVIEMDLERTHYQAFLLRLWTTPDGTEERASVMDVATGATHAFRNLDQLCTWLNRTKHADGVAPRATQSGTGPRSRAPVPGSSDISPNPLSG